MNRAAEAFYLESGQSYLRPEDLDMVPTPTIWSGWWSIGDGYVVDRRWKLGIAPVDALTSPLVTLGQEARDNEWRPLAEFLLQGGDIMADDAPAVPNYDPAQWDLDAAQKLAESAGAGQPE